MINHDMEDQSQNNYATNYVPNYAPQQYVSQQQHYQATYSDNELQPRASVMSIRQTNKLQELREKCFERLANQRQAMIKQRRYSQMPTPSHS
jgi:hypothetical protein